MCSVEPIVGVDRLTPNLLHDLECFGRPEITRRVPTEAFLVAPLHHFRLLSDAWTDQDRVLTSCCRHGIVIHTSCYTTQQKSVEAMSNERPNKRARSAAACTRCKHRKQRCDNGIPACAACRTAGEVCSYENRVYPAEYVQDLEARLAEFERQLQTQHRLQHGDGFDQQQRTPQTPVTIPATAAAVDTVVQHDDDEAESAFDMLSSTTYLGTSSGFPLARTVQAAIGPPGASFSRPTKDVSISHAEPVSPNGAQGMHFISTYLRKVHIKHPFMSPRRISELHHACQPSALSARPIDGDRVSARIGSFIIHLIYAIGARYMQLSQNDYHCNSNVCTHQIIFLSTQLTCCFYRRAIMVKQSRT
jgi:hypothetical protein